MADAIQKEVPDTAQAIVWTDKFSMAIQSTWSAWATTYQESNKGGRDAEQYDHVPEGRGRRPGRISGCGLTPLWWRGPSTAPMPPPSERVRPRKNVNPPGKDRRQNRKPGERKTRQARLKKARRRVQGGGQERPYGPGTTAAANKADAVPGVPRPIAPTLAMPPHHHIPGSPDGRGATGLDS